MGVSTGWERPCPSPNDPGGCPRYRCQRTAQCRLDALDEQSLLEGTLALAAWKELHDLPADEMVDIFPGTNAMGAAVLSVETLGWV